MNEERSPAEKLAQELGKVPGQVRNNRLRELRRSLGLNQTQVGVGIGMRKNSAATRISNYEQGEMDPTLETCFKLARFFGTSIEYIWGEAYPEEPRKDSV